MKKIWRFAGSVALFVFVALSGPQQVANAAAVQFQYVYDDNGRLLEVTDSAGTVVGYSYDVVGNILSVSRSALSNPNALAIFGFQPQTAVVGTTVVVQGQGFSTTASNNGVMVNGVAAAVAAATSTHLSVVVPAGATSGLIAVTVGGVTAMSSTSLTVPQLPTINSVSPNSAVQGTSSIPTVTVTGTNLTGASFVFQPAGVPAAIGISNVLVNAAGTSATMSLTPQASVYGSFTLVATTGTGASSPVAAPGNTFSVISNNPTIDSDGDGIPDVVELVIGSNPLVASTSGTGIPDGWALYFGLSPSDPAIGGRLAPNGLTYLASYQRGLNPTIASLSPPAVSAVVPAAGATGVPTTSGIVARFSTPLLAGVPLASAVAAINAYLPATSGLSASTVSTAGQILQGFLQRTCCGSTLSNGVIQVRQSGRIIPGAIYLSNDQLSVTFIPAVPLSSSTAFAVTVQGARALSSVSQSIAYTWGFSTGLGPNGNAPTILETSPVAGATGVPINAPIRVRFNEQINPGTLTPVTFAVTDATTGLAVPGTVQVDSGLITAAFVPTVGLPVSRTINVVLATTGIKDLSGNAMAATNASFSFGTAASADGSGPVFLAVSPQAGAQVVPPNALIQLEFDRPVDWISAVDAVSLMQGSNTVTGAIALSDANRRVTFTPNSSLLPSTSYQIGVSTQLRDLAGNSLVSPVSATFVTGTSNDISTPSVVAYSPSTSAPTTALVHVRFSKPMDAATVMSQGTFRLTSVEAPSLPVGGALSLSADGLIATFTPSVPLLTGTTYNVNFVGLTDLIGNALPATAWSFTTTGSGQQTGFHVTSTNPGAVSGVPLNSVISVVMSAPVDPTSVSSGAVSVSAGGQVLAGQSTLAADGLTLQFVPTTVLAASTTYVGQVGAVTDLSGNAAAAYSWQFSTGTSSLASGGLTVVSMSPAAGTSGVGVTTPVVLTFNSAVDPTTVNGSSVYVLASIPGCGGYCFPRVAVTVTLNGSTLTLVPASGAWPGNTSLYVTVSSGLKDLAGNSSLATLPYYQWVIGTAAVTDTVASVVTNVTPANGATGIGLNQPVVVTFSKSITTATTTSVVLLANGTPLAGTSLSVSADNRTVVVTPGTLPSSTVITVALHGLTDLSGNTVPDYSSEFTTAAMDTTAPMVVNQRPAAGATQVSVGTNIVVIMSKPLNAATVTTGSVHVSQNGYAVAGTVVLQNGNEIVFTPSSALPKGALIGVSLDASIVDLIGNALPTYQVSFTTQPDTSTIAPTVVDVSPPDGLAAALNGQAGPPGSVVFALRYNEPLNPASVTATNFALQSYDQYVGIVQQQFPAAVSLDATQTVVFVTPVDGSGKAMPLPPTGNGYYRIQAASAVQGQNGLQQGGIQTWGAFKPGPQSDSVPFTVTSVAPSNGATGVGDNAQIVLRFDKPIDPLTVTSATVQLTAGSTSLVEGSFSFANSNTELRINPQGLLPDGSTITVTLTGVLDLSGNLLPTYTSSFTTGTGADVLLPVVVAANPAAGESGIPLNAGISFVVNKALDVGTVNAKAFTVVATSTPSLPVPGSYTVSTDCKTVSFTPTAALLPGTNYTVTVSGPTDQVGNGLSQVWSFLTGTAVRTTALQVLSVSPGSSASTVPSSTQVEVVLSAAVNPGTVGAGAVNVSTGGVTVPGALALSPDLTKLTFSPSAPLTAGAVYTVAVSGFTDVAGNTVTPYSSSFTVQSRGDAGYSSLTVVSMSPAAGTSGVGVTTPVVLTFNSAVDPTTVNGSSVYVLASIPGCGGYCFPRVAVTVTLNGSTLTLVPASGAWPGNTSLYVTVSSGLKDLAGNSSLATLPYYQWVIGTAAVTDTVASVVTNVTPANGATGIGLNQPVVVTFSKSITTATTTSVVLLANGTPLAGTSLSVSADNRTVVVTPGTLPSSTVITVALHGLTDLSGNTVPDYSSEFTTAAMDTTAPMVVNQRPAAGATQVSVGTNIVVIMSKPLNAATVTTGSVHVSQNGYAVAGTVVLQNGNEIVFTPSSALPKGALIGVSLDASIVDLIGNALPTYQVSFTTQPDTSTIAPTVVDVSPPDGLAAALNGQAGPPGSVVFALRYNEPLNPASVTATNFALQSYDQYVGIVQQQFPAAVSLDATQTVVFVTPVDGSGKAMPLPPTGNGYYRIQAASAVQGQNGLQQGGIQTWGAFKPGPQSDSVPFTVTSVAPSNGATGVGDNAQIVLRFDKPIDPLTVTSATVQLTAGSTSLVEGSFSFANSNTELRINPQGLLPDGSTITVTLTGVLDLSGNLLPTYTSSFTTGTGSDVVLPVVVASNPVGGETGVPTNALINIVTEKVIDPGTAVLADFYLYDNTTAVNVAGSVSSQVVAGNPGTTVSFVPSAPLPANHSFTLSWTGLLDYVGNAVPANSLTFTSGAGPSATGPSVVGSTPAAGATGVSIRSSIVINFSAAISRESLGQISLKAGTQNISFTLQFANGDTQVTLIPAGLSQSTSYTVSLTGVTDLAGNPISGSSTFAFQTGTSVATLMAPWARMWAGEDHLAKHALALLEESPVEGLPVRKSFSAPALRPTLSTVV